MPLGDKLFDEWKYLTLSQFYDKRILMGIIRALSETLDEVYREQQELRMLLNIDAQEGVNLDHIGEIVSLSRTEAHEFIVTNEEFEMTDELYRKMLRYKILLNNSNATYYDIMEGVSIIWDTDNVIYREDPSRPATIFLDLKTVNVDGIDPGIGRILAIKPAGVGLLYYVNYLVDVNISGIEKAALPQMSVTTEFPFWHMDFWILNGFWKLDGKKYLDGTNHPLPVWVELVCPAKINESAALQIIHPIRVEPIFEKAGASMVMTSGFYFLDQSSAAIRANMNFGTIPAPNKEDADVAVILRKNLWYLDGTYELDGVKKINASITEEVL